MPESASTDSWDVPVTATQSRPALLPFFVLGRNNLNPRVTVESGGLTLKVVQTTRVPFAQIRSAEISAGLRSTYVTLAVPSWEYVIHLRDEDALVRFLGALDAAGVPLGSRARARQAG